MPQRKARIETVWTLSSLLAHFGRASDPRVRLDTTTLRQVIDTGILKTVAPLDASYIVLDLLARKRRMPFLRAAARASQLAAGEIEKHGFPVQPESCDLLRAPASVLESYRLRSAIEKLDSKLKAILMPRVVDALVDEKENSNEWFAIKQFAELISAAIEIGICIQRQEVRPFEPAARVGRRVLKGSMKGNVAAHQQRRQQYREYQAECDRLKRTHPQMSRRRIAELIGKKFGVSYKTILRNTRFPTK